MISFVSVSIDEFTIGWSLSDEATALITRSFGETFVPSEAKRSFSFFRKAMASAMSISTVRK